MKKGFTLLEVLVASLLMGMLVTILTMIFNQSSIAWRTGRSNVSNLSLITKTDSAYQYVADSAIPFLGAGKKFCTVSPWRDVDKEDAAHNLYERGIETIGTLQGADKRLPNVTLSFSFENTTINGLVENLGSGTANKGKNYVVGVKSAGPDRKFAEDGLQYAEDDITTWPDGVE